MLRKSSRYTVFIFAWEVVRLIHCARRLSTSSAEIRQRVQKRSAVLRDRCRHHVMVIWMFMIKTKKEFMPQRRIKAISRMNVMLHLGASPEVRG